jgi:hypothetical protein
MEKDFVSLFGAGGFVALAVVKICERENRKRNITF